MPTRFLFSFRIEADLWSKVGICAALMRCDKTSILIDAVNNHWREIVKNPPRRERVDQTATSCNLPRQTINRIQKVKKLTNTSIINVVSAMLEMQVNEILADGVEDELVRGAVE